MPRPLAITFDVYGTLTRWDETLRETLETLLTDKGVFVQDLSIVANAFDAESRRLQAEGAFQTYRTILTQSLRPAFAIAGAQPSVDDAAMLLERLSAVPPHSDVRPVLDALASRYRLAPISNSDDDLIAGTIRGLGSPFELVVTAEQAQAYKPNPELFRFALRRLGLEPADVLHVAQGMIADLSVCSALGIRCIWVNRTGASLQKGLNPIAIIGDLTPLPAIVAAL